LTTSALETYNPYQSMPIFSKNHVVILPHAEDYRDTYNISLSEVLATLNEPELHEGLANERYTAEKTIGKHRIYLYYYQTLPLQAQQNELYAIIDFFVTTYAIMRSIWQWFRVMSL
jgi:hypothetical protein